eukprot:2584109-Rhodomonas_salina.1
MGGQEPLLVPLSLRERDRTSHILGADAPVTFGSCKFERCFNSYSGSGLSNLPNVFGFWERRRQTTHLSFRGSMSTPYLALVVPGPVPSTRAPGTSRTRCPQQGPTGARAAW